MRSDHSQIHVPACTAYYREATIERLMYLLNLTADFLLALLNMFFSLLKFNIHSVYKLLWYAYNHLQCDHISHIHTSGYVEATIITSISDI
jgi:hypothetical protein